MIILVPGASVARSTTSRLLVRMLISDVLYNSLVGNYRHFMREDLPRIRYANPAITIEIQKIPKSKADTWQSSLSMEFSESLPLLIPIIER